MLELDQKGGTVRDGLAVDKNGRAVARKSGRLTVARAESGRTVMLEWACREDDDLDDPARGQARQPRQLSSRSSRSRTPAKHRG